MFKETETYLKLLCYNTFKFKWKCKASFGWRRILTRVCGSGVTPQQRVSWLAAAALWSSFPAFMWPLSSQKPGACCQQLEAPDSPKIETTRLHVPRRRAQQVHTNHREPMENSVKNLSSACQMTGCTTWFLYHDSMDNYGLQEEVGKQLFACATTWKSQFKIRRILMFRVLWSGFMLWHVSPALPVTEHPAVARWGEALIDCEGCWTTV